MLLGVILFINLLYNQLVTVHASSAEDECMAVGSSEIFICCDRRRQDENILGITFLTGVKKNARIVQKHGEAVLKFVLDPMRLEPCSIEGLFYGDRIFVVGHHVAHSLPASNIGDVEPSVVGVAYNACRQYQAFNGNYVFQEAKQEAVNAALLQNVVIHGLEIREKQRRDDPVQELVMKFVLDPVSSAFYGETCLAEAGQLPALEVRFPNGQRGFYPLDCLDILKCQKVPMAKFNLVCATLHDNILKRNAVKAPVRFQKTADCLALIEKYSEVYQGFRVCYSPVQMIHLDIRGKPQIVTGTGALLPDAKARFNLRGHRYHDPSSCKKWKVLNGSSQNIQEPIRKLMIEAQTRGLDLAQPEINSFNAADFDNKDNWTAVFDDLLEYGYAFVLVINPRRDRNPKTHHMFKCCELIYGVQTQHCHKAA